MSEVEISDSAGQASAPSKAVWLIPALLVVAIISAVVGKMSVVAYERTYYPPDHGQMGDPPEYILAVRDAMTKNSAIGYGIFGAVFAGLLGAAVGASYSVAGAIKGLIAGVVLGGLAGAVGAGGGTFLEHNYRQADMDTMLRTAMVVSGIFATTCFATMFTTVAAGSRPTPFNAAVNPIVLAVIGVIAYVVIAAAAFPIFRPETLQPPEPETSLRYLLLGCVTMAAVVTCVSLRTSGKQPASEGEIS